MVDSASDPFGPYVTASPDRPPPNNPLLDKPDWGAAWLWKSGAIADGMAALCPAALAALELAPQPVIPGRSEEHTSELQSLMRISYAVFCLKKKRQQKNNT